MIFSDPTSPRLSKVISRFSKAAGKLPSEDIQSLRMVGSPIYTVTKIKAVVIQMQWGGKGLVTKPDEHIGEMIQVPSLKQHFE